MLDFLFVISSIVVGAVFLVYPLPHILKEDAKDPFWNSKTHFVREITTIILTLCFLIARLFAILLHIGILAYAAEIHTAPSIIVTPVLFALDFFYWKLWVRLLTNYTPLIRGVAFQLFGVLLVPLLTLLAIVIISIFIG